jgi:hypothetical protein
VPGLANARRGCRKEAATDRTVRYRADAHPPPGANVDGFEDNTAQEISSGLAEAATFDRLSR